MSVGRISAGRISVGRIRVGRISVGRIVLAILSLGGFVLGHFPPAGTAVNLVMGQPDSAGGVAACHLHGLVETAVVVERAQHEEVVLLLEPDDLLDVL